MDYCLGFEILKKCTDYVNYELSVFNIGVFMGVIGVFFAGFQLIDSIHKIRFKIRYNKIILFLLILPLLTSVIGTLLPFIPGEPLPFLGYTIFWEIFTALYIILIGGFLIKYLFFNKIKNFDTKNGNINGLYIHCLAKNKGIENIVEELRFFFNDFLAKYNKEIEENKWGYAHQFITILLNERFIDYLIENPFTIQIIISLYQKEKRFKFSNEEKEFLGKIILGSFANNKSFLVHELNGNFNIDYRNKNGIILKRLIEDLGFLRKLNIFGRSNTYNYSNDPIFANNYLQFITKVIEEFLNKERISENYKEYKLLYKVFETQAHIIQQSFYQIDKFLLGDLLGNNYGYKLYELNPVLLECYGGKNFPEFKETNKKIYLDKYNINDSNNNLIDAFAFGIFEIMRTFSNFKNENIRKYTLEFTSVLEESVLSNEIEKRILILLRQDIVKNLTGGYEMVSIVFWENYSWHITNYPENIEKKQEVMDILKLYAEKLPKLSEGYIYAYTEDTLNDPYKKEMAIKKANEIIKDLFPDYIEYDRKNNYLSIYDRDRLSYDILDLGKILETGKVEIIQKDEK